MRWSILANDPGYDPRRTKRIRHVTVDGRTVTDFVTVDEDRGYVDQLIADPERPGDFKRDPVSPDRYLIRRVSGRTEITWRRGDRDWDASRRGDAKVQVGLDPTTRDILVQVFSIVRPGAIKQGRIDKQAYIGLSEAAIAQKAGLVGGAVAEMLCEQFGDTIDPHEAARVAVAQCALMLADNRIIVDPTNSVG